MAVASQVRKASVVGIGVGLLALCAGTYSLFAPPGHKEGPAVIPPLVLPRPSDVPAVRHAAPATPDTHRRSAPCDGAQYEIARSPRPATPPQSWFTSDDYPWLALVGNKTGITTTDLVIDARGAVIGCGVSNSSGHFSLDTRSCSVFKRRARFEPAEDMRGCPVPSVWHQRVRWQIPAG